MSECVEAVSEWCRRVSIDTSVGRVDCVQVSIDTSVKVSSRGSNFNSLLISPDLARRFVEFYGKWMDEGAREQVRRHTRTAATGVYYVG